MLQMTNRASNCSEIFFMFFSFFLFVNRVIAMNLLCSKDGGKPAMDLK